MKIKNFNEAAWVLGIILISLGTCLLVKANFGISSVAAPAYVIHQKLIQIFSWYTLGTSDYIFQGLILILSCILTLKFKLKYLLSFFTAVLYGLSLDLWQFILGPAAYSTFLTRSVSFGLGILICGAAIALFFRTTLPLQCYELFVVIVSKHFNLNKSKFKFIYDIALLILAIGLMLIFFKQFRFDLIGVGTILCAVLNAPLISLFGKIYDKFIDFSPRYPKLQKFFDY